MSILSLQFRTALVGLLLFNSAWAQSPSAQLDDLMKKMKPRSEVLDSAPDLVLQVVLPPQYSQCLHASFAEASQQNNVAHRYLLEQIDFLVTSGLTTSSIQAIIAYGHAITNVTFASELGKSIDKLGGSDFKERQNYIYRTFTRLACVNTFSDERVKPALSELIKSTRPKQQPPR
jgi:hypothetical protein